MPSPTEPDGENAEDPGGFRRWGLFFGLAYFVQSVCEPTTGLLAQPLRVEMTAGGRSIGEITSFMALASLPWALKPFYGLLSDFVPLGGSHRRAYLQLWLGVVALGLAGLGLLPEGGTGQLALAVLFVASMGVAFSDVVVDALMVEVGQPRGLTGTIQSIQWTCGYIGTGLVGLAGGYLASQRSLRGVLVACGVFALLNLLFVCFLVDDPPRPPAEGSAREAAGRLLGVVREPAVIGAAAFLFLWAFNPFSASVQHLHLTQVIGLDETVFGGTLACTALGGILASTSYAFYCRRIAFDRLVHLSIVAGIATTACYWLVRDPTSALAVSLVSGFTYMVGSMIQLDLAARTCPPAVAGTVFAVLMAFSNLAMSLGDWVGGQLYDGIAGALGAAGAYRSLVAMGALTSALCWFIVPFLLRHLPPEDGAAPESAQPCPERGP